MGTILKERGELSFRSLNGIREAYQRAFSKKGGSVLNALDEPGLRYAAAVRNLLIHKRGIVDTEFLDQVAGIPDLPPLSAGDRFPLTGKICRELSDACRGSAIWLVNAVHAWIIGNPDRLPEGTDGE